MLRTGHELLRDQRVLHSNIDWAGEKPEPWNVLDTMVGDRKSDMGAGWAVGARTFEVSSQQGLPQVIPRVLDELDAGDEYDPMRW